MSTQFGECLHSMTDISVFCIPGSVIEFAMPNEYFVYSFLIFRVLCFQGKPPVL